MRRSSSALSGRLKRRRLDTLAAQEAQRVELRSQETSPAEQELLSERVEVGRVLVLASEERAHLEAA